MAKVASFTSPFLGASDTAYNLSNVRVQIYGLEMQKEIEEDLQVEDFVRVLSVELSIPSSFLVTVSSLPVSASSAPSPVS